MDACALTLFLYGDPNHKFARTLDQVEANCRCVPCFLPHLAFSHTQPSSRVRKSKEAESCVRDQVKQCYQSPVMKQYFALMMRGPSGLLKKSCSRKGMREVIRHADCLSASKPALDACTRAAIRETVRVSKADPKLFLPASCCVVSKARECSESAVKSACHGASLEYIRSEMKAFQGEAIDLACGSIHDHRSAKCQGVFSKLPPLDPQEELPRSLLPVTLRIMSQFLTA